jgi:hypothetical protein
MVAWTKDLFQIGSGRCKNVGLGGLSYERSGGTTEPITHEKRRAFLRTENPIFPLGDDGAFVRDAYDFSLAIAFLSRFKKRRST